MDLKDHAEDMAKELRGNWRKFEGFAWDYAPEDPDEYGVVDTHNRDSGLIAQSNAAAIEKELKSFEGEDCYATRFNHWGHGWLEGYVVRVYQRGSTTEFTPAFLKLVELELALADSPLLDDSDYYAREHERAVEAIEEHHWILNDPPEDWAKQVFSWLWQHNQSELENVDDQGARPSEKAVKAACVALGFDVDDDE